MIPWKRAKSKEQAVEQMSTLLSHGLFGSRKQRLATLFEGRTFAREIWDRFEVGVSLLQQKHFKWYVANHMPHIPAERLRVMWECVCFVTKKLGHFDNWWSALDGEMRRACESRGCEPLEKPTFKRTKPSKPSPQGEIGRFVFDGSSLPKEKIEAVADFLNRFAKAKLETEASEPSA